MAMTTMTMRISHFALTLLAIACVTDASDVTELTPTNYDRLTDGKAVFIKFFAPWCGHCKRMASDWEKLAKDWDKSEVGLIAEVDCTSKRGKPLCQTHGIESFPTLKFGDPTDLDEYNGGRTYDALSEFAKENLVPLCTPDNLQLCDEERAALIKQYLAMSADELEKLVEAEETKLVEAEKKFSTEVDALQEKYAELEAEKNEVVASVRDGDLGIMKAVSRAMEKQEKEKIAEEIQEKSRNGEL